MCRSRLFVRSRVQVNIFLLVVILQNLVCFWQTLLNHFFCYASKTFVVVALKKLQKRLLVSYSFNWRFVTVFDDVAWNLSQFWVFRESVFESQPRRVRLRWHFTRFRAPRAYLHTVVVELHSSRTSSRLNGSNSFCKWRFFICVTILWIKWKFFTGTTFPRLFEVSSRGLFDTGADLNLKISQLFLNIFLEAFFKFILSNIRNACNKIYFYRKFQVIFGLLRFIKARRLCDQLINYLIILRKKNLTNTLIHAHIF